MADNGGRPVTSREIQAMIFNLKEQRILNKTMQTLELEENYAMKLIGLGNRQVKIGHRRMKNKVRVSRSRSVGRWRIKWIVPPLNVTFHPLSLLPSSSQYYLSSHSIVPSFILSITFLLSPHSILSSSLFDITFLLINITFLLNHHYLSFYKPSLFSPLNITTIYSSRNRS